MRIRAGLALVLAGSIALVGCSDSPDEGSTDAPSTTTSAPPLSGVVRAPAEQTTVLAGATSAQLAAEASRTFFDTAPVVVLSDDEPGALDRSAALAVEIGAPVLIAPPPPGPPPTGDPTPPPVPPDPSTDTSPTSSDGSEQEAPTPTVNSSAPFEEDLDLTASAEELQRLQPEVVVAAGPGAEALAASLFDESDILTLPAGSSAGDLAAQLPALQPPAPVDSVAVLTTDGPETRAAQATVEAAGATVIVSAADPRADGAAIAALAENRPAHVVGLGADFGTAEELTYRVGVASTGVELPGGGQVVYPNHRHVALYGNPTTPALGSLGEQSVAESVTRVQELAAEYQPFTDQTVVPTFEIIASVASSVPSSGGDYSTEMTADDLRPYVDAAAEAGIYVVLDLQPGRADFLTQAKQFEEFLVQPHVGLALDPEWRLKPGQVHLEQVGTVTAAEINSVVTWLADLTRAHNLPQKILVLHQFKTSMISDRQQVDTSRDELAVLIHVDGFGPPGSKFATWNTLRADPPPNVWWGWKNFIDEDSPTFTPQETMAIDPVPYFVSYQ